MSQPVFTIGGTNYAQYIEELTPVRNDLDADGSGRNLLDGLMYRTRIAQKEKWTVKCCRLTAVTMASLAAAVDATYVNVTLLNPKTNSQQSKSYYISSFTYGSQRYDPYNGEVYYDGCTFNMIER